MARNPDPTLKLTSSKGVTRTLDDWQTTADNVTAPAIIALMARDRSRAAPHD